MRKSTKTADPMIRRNRLAKITVDHDDALLYTLDEWDGHRPSVDVADL